MSRWQSNKSHEDSEPVGKEPCPACRKKGRDRSGDNLVRYDDGHGHCFACDYHEHGDGKSHEPQPRRPQVGKPLIDAGEIKALPKRKLKIETCKKFGYSIGRFGGKTVQIAPHYDAKGNLVAQHLRTADKEFWWRGDFDSAVLFGQQLWRDGGKRLIITEGEIDAMSISQLQDNRWPVVSIQTGASSAAKAIKKSIQWIERFEEVIFAFDMDEPGQAAAQKCAAILTPGKAKIARLPYKDANECLKKGATKELMDSLWGAKEQRPDGIVTVADIIADVLAPVEFGLPWPWDALTEMTYGIRRGEVYAIGAGTGVGKTDVFTQIIARHIDVLDLKVGAIYLEQQPKETTLRVAGKQCGMRLHVPDAGWTEEGAKAAVTQLMDSEKLFMYDHFGSTDWEVVRLKIKELYHLYGVKDIFLDHLTALAAHADDERKALEEIMAEIAGLAQELDITIYLISHLATPDGTPHEEGGRVMIRHFKGSRAIGFWCHFMFGLERDQQAEDEATRHTTTFRVLKDRYTGQATGKVFYLKYDGDTGMLEIADAPKPPCPFPTDNDEEDGDSDY